MVHATKELRQQFLGGGPLVVERNTFIDVEDEKIPGPVAVLRGTTLPARLVRKASWDAEDGSQAGGRGIEEEGFTGGRWEARMGQPAAAESDDDGDDGDDGVLSPGRGSRASERSWDDVPRDATPEPEAPGQPLVCLATPDDPAPATWGCWMQAPYFGEPELGDVAVSADCVALAHMHPMHFSMPISDQYTAQETEACSTQTPDPAALCRWGAGEQFDVQAAAVQAYGDEAAQPLWLAPPLPPEAPHQSSFAAPTFGSKCEEIGQELVPVMLPTMMAPAEACEEAGPGQAMDEEDKEETSPPAPKILPPPVNKLPQTLDKRLSPDGKFGQIYWTVDARKLRGNDKQAVSPPFDLSFAGFPHALFKLMLYPKIASDKRDGVGFKKASGRGVIKLKCERELSEGALEAECSLTLCKGLEVFPLRGPFTHDFAQSAICGLPKEHEDWDFRSAVDPKSTTFTVLLEVSQLL